MAEPLKPFAVIVVNFGSSSLVALNLSAAAVPDGGFVVIVDCFSTVREREDVAQLCADRGWRAVLLDDNVGFGAGVNFGADAAIAEGAEVIITLNPDASATADALAQLVRAAQTKRALVSPNIITGEGRPWFAGMDLYLDEGFSAARRRREEFEGQPRREWATGACFAITADLWTELSGFDDSYFLYWEDIDLSHRILDAGGELILTDASVVHDEGGTHEDRRRGREKSETYYYYNIRNRLLYGAIHLDDERLRHWMHTARRESYRILLQGGRHQLLTSFAPWRAYRRGLRDGRAMVRARRPGIR